MESLSLQKLQHKNQSHGHGLVRLFETWEWVPARDSPGAIEHQRLKVKGGAAATFNTPSL